MIDYQLKFILVFFSSLAIAIILTKIFIGLAKRWQIVDKPGLDRKIHSQPIPLLGGWPIFLTVLIMTGLLFFKGQLLDPRISSTAVLFFLLAGLVLVINGYFDDKFSWPAKYSIWGPIIATILVLASGLRITYVTAWDGGVFYLDNLLAGDFIILILTALWLLGMTYTTKLLDGLDGLTSSIGLVASFIIFIVSLSWDVVGSTTSLLAIILAGSLAGFLLWNWQPAKIFLGEGGSTFIGFSLGVLAIISGSKIATALLVMGLPVLDVVLVIINRWRRRQPIWHGDQEHLHFRLLHLGLTQWQVVLFLSLVSLLFGSVSLFFTTKAKLAALSLLLLLMLALSLWLNWRLRKPSKSA